MGNFSEDDEEIEKPQPILSPLSLERWKHFKNTELEWMLEPISKFLQWERRNYYSFFRDYPHVILEFIQEGIPNFIDTYMKKGYPDLSEKIIEYLELSEEEKIKKNQAFLLTCFRNAAADGAKHEEKKGLKKDNKGKRKKRNNCANNPIRDKTKKPAADATDYRFEAIEPEDDATDYRKLAINIESAANYDDFKEQFCKLENRIYYDVGLDGYLYFLAWCLIVFDLIQKRENKLKKYKCADYVEKCNDAITFYDIREKLKIVTKEMNDLIEDMKLSKKNLPDINDIEISLNDKGRKWFKHNLLNFCIENNITSENFKDSIFHLDSENSQSIGLTIAERQKEKRKIIKEKVFAVLRSEGINPESPLAIRKGVDKS